MKIIQDSPWNYTYAEDDDGSTQYLQVLCGGVGLFETTIILTSEEVSKSKIDPNFIPDLINSVRNDPDKFSDRNSRDAEKIIHAAIKQKNNMPT